MLRLSSELDGMYRTMVVAGEAGKTMSVMLPYGYFPF